MSTVSVSRVGGRRGPGGFFPPVLVVLCCVLTGAGCGSEPGLEEWTLDLVVERTIGGPDGGEETAFYEPTDLQVDGNGRVHVLDTGNHRVQVFSADGEFERTLGRSGEGPGDLMRPEGLWVYPDGEVIVADTGNARLQRFGPAGDPLPPVTLDSLPLDLVGGPKGLWVLRMPQPTMVLGPDPSPLVQAMSRDGVPGAGTIPPRSADVGILYFIANVLRIARGPGDGFAVADTHVRSRIRRYDADGRLEAEIPVLYKAQAWAPLGELPREVSDHTLAGIARTATDLAWDRRRSLYWLLSGTTDRRQDGSWVTARELYRYDPEGGYRGTVILPFEARRICVGRDGAVWILDTEGVVRRMKLRDPERVIAGAAPLRNARSATPSDRARRSE